MCQVPSSTEFDTCGPSEVETDGDGIQSSSLRDILENWPADKPKPKVLYSVPVRHPLNVPRPNLNVLQYGCNPSGATAAVARKRETLELARQHDIIIFEGSLRIAEYSYIRLPYILSFYITDDPYYFLYYGTRPRPPSYFTLELEQPEVGRVLRFDSLSKILSSGIRIGFASGPEPLLNAMDLHVGGPVTAH